MKQSVTISAEDGREIAELVVRSIMSSVVWYSTASITFHPKKGEILLSCGSRVITSAGDLFRSQFRFLGELLPLVAVMRHKSRWNLIISCGLFIKTRCRHIQLRDNIVQRCRNVTFQSRTCYWVVCFFFLYFKFTLNVFHRNRRICFIRRNEAHWWSEEASVARSLSKRKQTELSFLKMNLRLQMQRILMKLYIKRFLV